MGKLKQVMELVKLLPQRGALRAFLRWKPFSITSYKMLHALRAQGLAPRTILDAGANIGQFARAATEVYPGARIISFEAVPDVAAVLERNLSKRRQVRVVKSAVGNSEGSLSFYRNNCTVASSALPLHDNQKTSFPQAQHAQKVEVPVARLDTLLREEPLERPVLLKLDLQGFELEALRGAERTLEHTDYILLEATFKTMYNGEPLFEEVFDFLRAAGFRLLRPMDVLADARGEIVQMDALFARSSPA